MDLPAKASSVVSTLPTRFRGRVETALESAEKSRKNAIARASRAEEAAGSPWGAVALAGGAQLSATAAALLDEFVTMTIPDGTDSGMPISAAAGYTMEAAGIFLAFFAPDDDMARIASRVLSVAGAGASAHYTYSRTRGTIRRIREAANSAQ